MRKKRFTWPQRFVMTGIGMLFILFACEMARGGTPQDPKSSQGPGSSQSPPGDLTQVSIENLMNMEISSASKKEQPVSRTAAAVFVLTQEDIRRSGMTTLPDVLRLVPGLDVAQIDADNWAVSSRGFNGRFANKLLVLIDGRSLYSPEFAGVFWQVQDLMLEDIDRHRSNSWPGRHALGRKCRHRHNQYPYQKSQGHSGRTAYRRWWDAGARLHECALRHIQRK
jgi:hypothetical protein